MKRSAAVLLLAPLAACGQDITPPPPPVSMTECRVGVQAECVKPVRTSQHSGGGGGWVWIHHPVYSAPIPFSAPYVPVRTKIASHPSTWNRVAFPPKSVGPVGRPTMGVVRGGFGSGGRAASASARASSAGG